MRAALYDLTDGVFPAPTTEFEGPDLADILAQVRRFLQDSPTDETLDAPPSGECPDKLLVRDKAGTVMAELILEEEA